MRREELFGILGQIDDRFIIPARRERRSIPWQNYVGVAAALCVIVTGVWVLVHMGSSGRTLLPGKPTDPTSATTAPSDPTDESTEPTTPTETDPTGSTEPTQDEELQQYIEDWENYCSIPLTFMIIPGYDPDPHVTYEYAGKDFDESGMIAGNYYAVDDGEVYYLTDEHLRLEKVTAEHIYYVMSSDPSAVYRCTLHGEEHTLIYRSDFGSINQVYYSGIDSNGQLILLEEGEYRRAITYDISTKTTEVLLERVKGGIFYRPHSLDYTAENKGPVLQIMYKDENGGYVYENYLIEEGRYLP